MMNHFADEDGLPAAVMQLGLFRGFHFCDELEKFNKFETRNNSDDEKKPFYRDADRRKRLDSKEI